MAQTRTLFSTMLEPGGPITITNPATNGVSLSYTLPTASPIRSRRAIARTSVKIGLGWFRFSRGGNMDQARYGLTSGVYSFTGTDHGWELYKR